MKNYSGMTDEKLALQYAGGDNRAFDELLTFVYCFGCKSKYFQHNNQIFHEKNAIFFGFCTFLRIFVQ